MRHIGKGSLPNPLRKGKQIDQKSLRLLKGGEKRVKESLQASRVPVEGGKKSRSTSSAEGLLASNEKGGWVLPIGKKQ